MAAFISSPIHLLRTKLQTYTVTHTTHMQQARRPIASLLITGCRLSKILDLVQGLKTEVPSGCQEEISNFKIIMIDDITLWSKLESTW